VGTLDLGRPFTLAMSGSACRPPNLDYAERVLDRSCAWRMITPNGYHPFASRRIGTYRHRSTRRSAASDPEPDREAEIGFVMRGDVGVRPTLYERDGEHLRGDRAGVLVQRIR